MIHRLNSLFILLFFLPVFSFAQYPALQFSTSNLTVGVGGTVNVPVTAGSNWSNITQISGSFTYDPTVISWNSMQNWGMSYAAGAIFSSPTAGVVTFTYSSLISVGSTLGAGATIFDLQFNVIGAIGATTPINFTGTPQAMYWGNGFGWSGSNYAVTPGSVAIACLSPNASFTESSSFYTTSFTNTTTNAGSSSWDFGDGATSTSLNPSHTYATPGTYTVCLIETNTCGSDTTCSSVNICTNMPVTNFTLISNQTTISCVDGTSNTPTTWLWDFGDGTTATTSNPSHTYASSGTYTVCLISGNGCGMDTSCQTITLVCPNTNADFSSSVSLLTATFTDNSINNPTSWEWDFGDGNTSTSQNPNHTYADTGVYNVCLISYNDCGADTSCMNVTVDCLPMTAVFTFAQSFVTGIFTDYSPNNPTSWFWDFGDGTTSTEQNPVHLFPNHSNYDVCLTVASDCDTNTFCQTIFLFMEGLDELSLEDLNIYPNPAKDILNIHSTFQGMMHVKMYNLQGQLMTSFDMESNQNKDFSTWSKGTYVLIIDMDGKLVSRMLILK